MSNVLDEMRAAFDGWDQMMWKTGVLPSSGTSQRLKDALEAFFGAAPEPVAQRRLPLQIAGTTIGIVVLANDATLWATTDGDNYQPLRDLPQPEDDAK